MAFEDFFYTEGYGFEGNVTLELFGKAYDLPVTVYSDDGSVADIQREAYDRFIENASEICDEVIERIIGYYNDEERFSYGPDDSEEAARWWPEITAAEEMTQQITPDAIIIEYATVMEDVYGGRCVGITFGKKWGNDIEDNGIGVLIVNEEVSEVGFRDIVL